MQVIGFNLSKIKVEKSPALSQNPAINTNIEFTNIQKESVELLKDSEASKIDFKYSINYSNPDEKKKDEPLGEILFEGAIILALSKEESKKLNTSWKKKETPNSIKIPLFNLILRRCSAKSLTLADETGLPAPIPLPKITTQQKPQE